MHPLTLFLALLIVAGPLPGDDEPTPRTLTAVRVSSDIEVDGRLDEGDWALAQAASDFRQFEPDEGAPPSHRTEVRVLYGNNALYVGAHLYDDAPDRIMRTLGRRDDFNQADWFIVSIDSYLDRKTAYTFGLNAAGVQMDGITTRDIDRSWDAVWDGATRVVADGWIVEMRIPYSMLRFSEADLQTWGINFQRIIPRISETLEWSLVRRSERGSGVVSHYGELRGLTDLRPRRNIQVTPYTVSRLQTEEGDTGHLRSEREMDFGGDFKVGISSNMILDASFNPDFGQVDADPAELNLTAFETFFPERRPFFIEGAQIFNFSYGREGGLIYTRRIGAGDPIIGAAKLSGRSDGGLSVGVMAAATGENFDPTRYYGVTRMRQEVGRFSSFGAMFTAFERRDPDLDPRRSIAGGVDWDLRMGRNTFKWDGQVSATSRALPGTGEAPEQGFAFSTGFDRLRGIWTYSVGFDLFDDHFNPNDLGRLRQGDFMRISTGFGHQINDNRPFGPFRRASLRFFSWQKWTYSDRLKQGAGFFLSSNWETRGFQEIEVRFFSDYLLGAYDPFETRGLGPWKRPPQINARTSFQTDSRRSWNFEPSTSLTLYDHAGTDFSVGLKSEWNAGDRLGFTANVNLNEGRDRTAWVANETFALLDNHTWAIGTSSVSPASLADDAFRPLENRDGLDALFAPLSPYEGFSDRYFVPIFGRRDTRSLDISLRSSVTFTPNLSLQLYGQLFVASGRYDQFSLLQDRDTLTPFDGFPKRYDFSRRSFQSNVVLRWEYRPGSTIFIVWSQARSTRETIDPFDLTGRSPYDTATLTRLGDTFDLFPTNVFLIKLNYKFLY